MHQWNKHSLKCGKINILRQATRGYKELLKEKRLEHALCSRHLTGTLHLLETLCLEQIRRLEYFHFESRCSRLLETLRLEPRRVRDPFETFETFDCSRQLARVLSHYLDNRSRSSFFFLVLDHFTQTHRSTAPASAVRSSDRVTDRRPIVRE